MKFRIRVYNNEEKCPYPTTVDHDDVEYSFKYRAWIFERILFGDQKGSLVKSCLDEEPYSSYSKIGTDETYIGDKAVLFEGLQILDKWQIWYDKEFVDWYLKQPTLREFEIP